MNKRIAACGLAATGALIGVAFYNDWFFLLWIGWGLIFGTIEVYALSRKARGDTLSEQIWLGTLSKSRWWSLFWRAFVVIFLSWLTAHFLFRI